jgi:hypothetical protein
MLKAGCLLYAVWKQLFILLIDLGRKCLLNDDDDELMMMTERQ